MTLFTDVQIAELSEDPNLESIHTGKIITEQFLFPVYDFAFPMLNALKMEPEDDILVTKHKDGTYFMHVMSEAKQYHYKAPWVSDDQCTYDEGAIYHV